jgi:hypothetical protein
VRIAKSYVYTEYISLYFTGKIGTVEKFTKDIMELGSGLNWLMIILCADYMTWDRAVWACSDSEVMFSVVK